MQTIYRHSWWIITASLLASATFASLARAQEAANAAKADEASEESEEDYYELMKIFADTFQEIDQNYVKDIDRRKLIDAAVRGMLAELDPYSEYFDPTHLDDFAEAISQEFGGVGIRVNFDDENRAIQVMTPIPGSPAYQAGIHAGDRIVEIDGQPVKDFPARQEIDRAVELLRGKPGEKVEVGVRHPGSAEDQVEKISLTRKLIQLDTVMGYSYNEDGSWNLMLDDEQKIGYLRLTHFTDRTSGEMKEALRSLKKQGMKGLILDLRFNPGGLLQAAIEVSDMFVEEGTIVSTDGRNSIPRTWAAKSYGTFTGFPMAVIVNHFSASASEVVSACLQDHDRAIIVGERSWGKGSVQDVIDMEGGKSALKLTTASYHRPSGKNIHRFPDSKVSDEWGVMPNDGYKIEFDFEEMLEFQKDRQERDIIGRQEEYKTTFTDRQLKAARTYLESQLSEPGTADEATGEDASEAETPAPNEGADQSSALPLKLRSFYRLPRQNAA